MLGLMPPLPYTSSWSNTSLTTGEILPLLLLLPVLLSVDLKHILE
jgi:hypothetical protein